VRSHRLPELDLDLGRAGRLVPAGVRIVLCLASALLVAGIVAYACGDLAAVGRALIGGG
jgi:hypothetical protein